MLHLHTCAALAIASFPFLAALREGPPAEQVSPSGFEIAGAPARCVELQANSFTKSTQESVAVATSVRGDTIVVWQSRRQELDNYGLYAQRFGDLGQRLGGEVRVNEHAPGAQTAPSVATDATGAVWFAWESFGQDGDAGGIVARRFDAELATSTAEVIVNEEREGQQGEVALACDPAGRAVIAWTTPAGPNASPGEQRILRARRFTPDGQPSGAAFVVAGAAGEILRNPCIAIDAQGHFTIAWARADESGRPNGIRARSYDAEGGALGVECALSPALDAARLSMPIEPVVALGSAGDLVAAWLTADGDDYTPTLRRFTWNADAKTWEGAAVACLDFGGPGYTSALDLALAPDGRALVAWNRHVDGMADVRGVDVDRDGRTGALRHLTIAREGEQALHVGGGARRIALRADGGMAVAWKGDSGNGDKSAANVTLFLPSTVEIADAEATNPLPAPTRFEADEPGAVPHDPPIYDPNGGIRRENFPLPESAGGPDFGFLGITETSLTPPDPHIAVSSTHVVEVVNAVIAFFKKDGTFQSQQQLSGASGFWVPAGAPASAFIFDPEVVYDPASDRFFVMACDRSGSQNFFDLAVSDDSDPNGTWFKYRFQTPAVLGAIDSPNLAVGVSEVYLAADFFGPDRYHIQIVEKAPLLSGGTPTTANTTITGTQSHGLPMAYSAAPVQYLIEALEAASNNTVRLHAILNPLTTPTIQTFTLSVPTYQQPEDPPQMGTSARPETFESRFWSAMYRNGSIWATHHTGAARVLQRWYQIDMQGWPLSANNPVLVQTGTIDPGPTVRTFFGSIITDSQDNVGLVFARSSPTEFISMSRTFRLAGDSPGATTPPVIMKASTSPDFTGRWGDYSAVVVDPDFDRVFWGGHEFRTSNWGTWIGTFGPCTVPINYCTAKLTSQGLLPAIAGTNEPSLGSNSFGLSIVNAIPNATLQYFHGPGPASTPWFNGTLCVQAPLVRGPASTLDGSGSATVPFAIQPALVGTERYFQYWFRDTQQLDGTGVGMTGGLQVTFCP